MHNNLESVNQYNYYVYMSINTKKKDIKNRYVSSTNGDNAKKRFIII
jgi:hypothetical protein